MKPKWKVVAIVLGAASAAVAIASAVSWEMEQSRRQQGRHELNQADAEYEVRRAEMNQRIRHGR